MYTHSFFTKIILGHVVNYSTIHCKIDFQHSKKLINYVGLADVPRKISHGVCVL